MPTVNFHHRLLLFYSEVSDGNIDLRFSTPKEVRTNRQNVFSPHKLISREVIEAAQIHSDRLLSLNSENTKMWRGMNVTGVDGFITNQTDAHLMIRMADCVPVVIYDPPHHAVGIFHAGWRGIVKGIHLTGLKRMIQDFQTNPQEIMVWLGPSIRACHYLMDKLPDQFQDQSWQDYISRQGSQYRVDLVNYLIHTFKTVQVSKKQITDSAVCTFESPNLFSHLRSQVTGEAEGRFAVVVKLM